MKNRSRFLGAFLVGLFLVSFFGGCTGEDKGYQKEPSIQVGNLSLSEPLSNLSVDPVYNSKLVAPMVVDLNLRGDVEMNKVVELELSAEPLIDAPNTTIEIILPDNVEYVSGDLNWGGNLNKNQKMSLKSYIKIGGAEGDFVIEGKAVSHSEGFTFGKSDFLYLSVFGNTVEVGDSPRIEPLEYGGMTYQIDVLIEYEDVARTYVPEISDEEDLNTLPKKKSDFSENESATESRAPGSGQIQIRGCILYKDYDGNWKPAKWLKVFFFDEDQHSPDDQLGTAKKVGSDGCFESDVIDNVDEPQELGARLDVYLKFVTHSNVAKVVNEHNGVYVFYTETKWEVPDGWVNFGSQGVDEYPFAAACEVFDTLMDGWDYYANTPGIKYKHGKVTCSWYPLGGTHSETDLDNGYSICVAYLDYMDEDVILRVYGESVMFGVFGEFPPNSTDECWWRDHCNRRDAWKVGWGFFASCISSGDQYYKDTVDQHITINVERKSDFSEWDGDGTGDDTPSAICGALWDIYDSHDDNQDTLSLGPDEIWDVFENYVPGGHHVYTIHGFWDGWFARRQNYRQEVWNIFSDHCIKYDYEPPVISNCYHSPDSPTPSDSVHVYCDVTDDVSGVKSVTCSYSVNGGLYTEIQMTKISGNTYRTSSPIPPQCDAEVTYGVEARDYAGKDGFSYVSSYTVGFKQLHVYPDYHDFGKMDRGETDTWTFHIENVCLSAGPMTWYVNVYVPWLSVSTTSGTTTTETDSVTVTIDTSNLECGRHYDGYIWVQTYYEEHPPIHIEVFINEYLELFVYPDSHDFGEMDKGEVDTWTFLIDNIWFTDIPFNIVENLSWISVSPTSGISPEIEYITVRIDTAGLECGQHYEGYIHMQTPCQDTPICVEVTIRGSGSPQLHVYPTSLNFGEMNEGREATLSFYIENAGGGELSWYIENYPSWIKSINPPDGTTTTETDTVDLTIDTTGLECGKHYTGGVSVMSNGGPEIIVDVEVTIRDDNYQLYVYPTSHDFGPMREGQIDTFTLHIENIWIPEGPLSWEITEHPSWITVHPTSETTPTGSIVTVTIHTAELERGHHEGYIHVRDGCEHIPVYVEVTIVERWGESDILLVYDDVYNQGHSTYYKDALAANGYPFDYWNIQLLGDPELLHLNAYSTVIWVVPNDAPNDTNQATLMNYLDAGGNLLITGQDIGWYIYEYLGQASNIFYEDYLHAVYVHDKTDLWTLDGVPGDPITDGLYIAVSGGDGADNQLHLSEIDPRGPAVTIFTYSLLGKEPSINPMSIPPRPHETQPKGIISSGSAALRVDTGVYKVVYFAFGLEAIDNSADRNIIMRKIVHWLQGTAEGSLPQLFNTNSYLVVGDDAYCTDVLGSAKISYGLALGGASENPEGRTHTLLTTTEHNTGNLIPVGGPAINPVADEFDGYFGITYNYDPNGSPPVFEISADGYTITLNLNNYPNEDICIVYLAEHNGRNVMLVWGYGWRGTYAGSTFMGDPANWQAYEGAHMLMLRWTDSNADGLVQMSEITVESYKHSLTAKTVIRGVVNWLRASADWILSLLFNTNSYLVVGDDAYCTDVLGSAKISYGLALGGASENPEGRTHTLLTTTEHNTGNLIPVGGPAINPVADEFDGYFGITYNYDPNGSPPVFEISADGYTITLNLNNYPNEDICIVYLAEHNGRNVMLVWGYGWRGTYAGSTFMGDPANWQAYEGAHMLMLRWTDSNADGLVQMSEITVESYT